MPGGFGGMHQSSHFDMDDDDGDGGLGGMFGRPPSMVRKEPSIKRNFACSLEELFTGCTKKMKITKTLIDASGRGAKVEKILTIDVKPGWKAGTKITFEREGDEQPGREPADIIFTLTEKEHPTYRRIGSDLHYSATVSLKQALCNPVIEVPTLDNRKLRVSANEVVNPSSQTVIQGEGMPITKQPGRRGNLIVNYNIVFPTSLSPQQKQLLQQALPS